MTPQVKANPKQGRTPNAAKGKTRRYRTLFVEPASLRVVMSNHAAQEAQDGNAQFRGRGRGFRMVSTVDAELDPVRKNVQDAAKAVLTWLASVIGHDEQTDLDAILDACLRPGPDARRVNFNALTEQINATLGTDLSAKRVRTAVRNLRKARAQKATKQHQPGSRPVKPRPADLAQSLRDRLMANRESLGGEDDVTLRRTLALEVLTAVRSAAGRLIDNDFGEGIPETVDTAALSEGIAALRYDAPRNDNDEADLDRFIRTLRDCDGEPEADMRLVIDGARVVVALAGKKSLPGVMARLNVLVAGRALITTREYVDCLIVLAGQAEALHDDAETKSLMHHVRRLPEDQRVPTPLRITSYCLNNTATHILERLFTGELEGDPWRHLAERCILRMQQRDSGFQLLRVTRLIHQLTLARLRHDDAIILGHFTSLGETAALQVLEDLAKFDNNDELIRAAQHYASQALPELRHRLIRAA